MRTRRANAQPQGESKKTPKADTRGQAELSRRRGSSYRVLAREYESCGAGADIRKLSGRADGDVGARKFRSFGKDEILNKTEKALGAYKPASDREQRGSGRLFQRFWRGFSGFFRRRDCAERAGGYVGPYRAEVFRRAFYSAQAVCACDHKAERYRNSVCEFNHCPIFLFCRRLADCRLLPSFYFVAPHRFVKG